jgi:hypothetical protein
MYCITRSVPRSDRWRTELLSHRLFRANNRFVHSRMESLRHHASRLPPFIQQLLLVGLVAFSASPIGIFIGILSDLSRRLHGPHPQVAQLNSNYNENDLDRVSYADIDMLNAIPREPTHAGYIVIGGSGFVGRCVTRPVHRCVHG